MNLLFNGNTRMICQHHRHVSLQPNKTCVELKRLKLHLQSFRSGGIFNEVVTNAIADDLSKAMKTRWMVVETNWKSRGGIRSVITVEVGKKK